MSDVKRFCTFHLGSHFFGVEVVEVQEIIRSQPMTRVPLAPAIFKGLINLRGQIVTALDLRQRLEMPPRAAGLLPTNVVVKSEGGAISMLVDEIGDVVEVDASSFEQPPETLSGIAKQLVRGV
jgi:purine-binding chemotaxis protein CheW